MKNMMHEEIPAYREATTLYRKNRRRTWLIVTLVTASLLLLALMSSSLIIGYRLLNPIPVHSSTETRTFKVGAGVQPTLNVADDNGLIHVQAGTGNMVTVTAHKVGDSFAASPGDFKVIYRQDGNTITVQVKNDSVHPFDFLNTSHTDVDVTVPMKSNLQLVTDSGDISVAGIEGKILLASNSGALQATDVSINNASQFTTDSGSIIMRGSIGTEGHYMFQSNSGAIDVTLPGSSSFRVDLNSISGAITTDFPISSQQQSSTDGKTISGNIGSSPLAVVSMQSDSGAIHLGHI